jgi:acetyl esterase/lipase
VSALSRTALAGLAAAMLAGCAVSPEADQPQAPLLGMYGTDAHLTPSKPDRTLRYARHPRGFADLRVPAGKGPFPLAVIFHGGCWKAGIADRNYMAPLATRWQQQGIATLNVDYREVGDGGGWPGSFADWAAAEDMIRDLAGDPRIDLKQLTFVGHSAGALPAQWLATSQGPDGPVGARAPAMRANAIVFDGPADLARDQAPFDALCEFSAVAPFMGGTAAEVPDRYAALSPLGHPSRLRRLEFVQARLPSPDVDALAALREAGVEVAVTLNPQASHFDVITPGAAAYDEVEPRVLATLRQQ